MSVPQHSPWRTFLGHCPVVTAYLAAHPCTSSPAWFLAHAANTFLRAVGQPAFVDNPLLGLLILLAIFLPHPQVTTGKNTKLTSDFYNGHITDSLGAGWPGVCPRWGPGHPH